MPVPHRRLWLTLLALALVVQLLGLYAPRTPDLGGAATPGLDKAAHAAMFAAVVLTALRAGLRPGPVVVLSLLHAGASELVQHLLLPDRSGDVLDVVADAVGVVLGVLVARVLSVGDRARTGPGRRGPPRW